MSKGIILLLSLIVILGAGLRFFDLTKVPPALNWDEVAIGYNAYSILETGKDEFGTSFPKYFRSLDDYKRPVYVYTTVASVGVFGLNDFAVRFPSALFGTLTILVAFFITRELFKNDKLALLTALTIAILPWHIQFSRAAFESTMGLFLTGLGVLLFFRAMRGSLWWLPLSQLAFGLSLYSYLGQRGVVPVLTVALFIIFRKDIRSVLKGTLKKRAILAAGILITLFFWTSLALDLTGPEGTIRYKATNIFENNQLKDQNVEQIIYAGEQRINLPRRIYQNDKLLALELVSRGYLTHFSPDFYFFERGQQHHHAPRMGILYLWMLPFFLIGGYMLVRKHLSQKTSIIWIWLLATPIAASVTFQLPHALRVAEMIIPVSIIIALGVYASAQFISGKWKRLSKPFILLLALVAVFFLGRFIYMYFVHLPHERSQEWVYGREEMVEFAESQKDNYDRIIASTRLEFPHIFFLYHTKYDPQKYLDQGGTISGSWDEEGNTLDKYEFHKFDYREESEGENILYIGLPSEFPDSVEPIKTINYLDGEPAILFVEG